MVGGGEDAGGAGGGATDGVSGLLGGDQSVFCVTHENIDATELRAGDVGLGSDGGGGSGECAAGAAAAAGGVDAEGSGAGGRGVTDRVGFAASDGWRGGVDGVCEAGLSGAFTQLCEDAFRAGLSSGAAGAAGGGGGACSAESMSRGTSISSVGCVLSSSTSST